MQSGPCQHYAPSLLSYKRMILMSLKIYNVGSNDSKSVGRAGNARVSPCGLTRSAAAPSTAIDGKSLFRFSESLRSAKVARGEKSVY